MAVAVACILFTTTVGGGNGCSVDGVEGGIAGMGGGAAPNPPGIGAAGAGMGGGGGAPGVDGTGGGVTSEFSIK